MSYTVAIIDDNVSDSEKIQRLVMNMHASEKFIPKVFSHPDSFPFSEHFDICILDIDMPGRNGFEVAREISQVSPESKIMFCSDYEDLVFRAFSLNVFFFIRKSHLEEDLESGFRKFLGSSEIGALLLEEGNESMRVPYSHIICIVVYGNQIVVRCRDHSEYLVRKTLKSMESELPSTLFAFASSSVIVNISEVERIIGSTVVMKDGSHIEASRRKLRILKDRYAGYRMECML